MARLFKQSIEELAIKYAMLAATRFPSDATHEQKRQHKYQEKLTFNLMVAEVGHGTAQQHIQQARQTLRLMNLDPSPRDDTPW